MKTNLTEGYRNLGDVMEMELKIGKRHRKPLYSVDPGRGGTTGA